MVFDNAFRLVGSERAVEVYGIRLVGVNAENGTKLLITIAFILILFFLSFLTKRLSRWLLKGRDNERIWFWTRQVIHLFTAAMLVLGIASIWFDDPTRLATALGLITAGLAFALQKVVTAVAGYFIILRGKTFNVGDRIRMGGVRGDVIALGFTQTTIMEMGQPPSVQSDEPAMWVRSRQYTGRVVAVSNSKIFDEPVYNYSQEFPFLWEELSLPIPYAADRKSAEAIILAAAKRHTMDWADLGADAINEMKRRYFLSTTPTTPKVYYRLTDNWLELTIRFIRRERVVRELKDELSREILAGLEEVGIGLASTTFEITGILTIRFQTSKDSQPSPSMPHAESPSHRHY